MQLNKLAFALTLFLLIVFSFSVSGQAVSGKISFSFTEDAINKVYTNSGEKQKLDFTISGLPSKMDVKAFKKQSALTGLKCNFKEAGIAPASASFPMNVDKFREELEKCGISHIYIAGNKVKLSNLISQEKATELAASVIDVPPIEFNVAYNNADNIGYFDYRIYYHELKLRHSMQDNYTRNLLKGHIDKLQRMIKEAKEEREDFINQHTK